MRSRARELNETGELERTVLAVRGAGLDARSFAGRDLVSELLRRRRADGSFDGLANWTAFGIMALRASGRAARSGAVAKSATWLARQQGPDGGFSVSGGGASFVDETGAALQGLAAAARGRGRPARTAIRWLRTVAEPRRRIRSGKGARLERAVDRLGGAGNRSPPARRRPRSGGRAARRSAYLGSLQQADGSFRYSRSSAQTPVWVTSQVVAALRRKTFPVRAPARRRARRSAPALPARAPAGAPATPARRRAGNAAQAVDELGEATPVVARRSRPGRRDPCAGRGNALRGRRARRVHGSPARLAAVALMAGGWVLLWRRAARLQLRSDPAPPGLRGRAEVDLTSRHRRACVLVPQTVFV